ncbi:putative transport and Golgi organization protein [Arabidopsis thaliana]
MGIVAFQWGEGENTLTLLQNRDNWDSWQVSFIQPWEPKPAAWDESNQIFSVLPVHSFGTWFGISKQGRLVFLVNPPKLNNLSPVLRPVDFLLREMSPLDFAREWSENSKLAKIMNEGMSYHIVVADMKSKSMFYIS